jgi:hypothetical protein
LNEVRAELAAGNKIGAIKALRTHTQWGLRESKDFIEQNRIDDPAAVAKLGPSLQGQPRERASCFPGHTRVETPTGPRAIASLAPGDLVWSWSGTGRVARPVTAVVSHPDVRLWEILLAGRRPLVTTCDHSFQTARGWVRSDQLRAGDDLGSGARVEGVRPTSARATVYNLHTALEHNYLVEGVVAHNFTRCRSLRVAWHRILIDRRRRAPRVAAACS